MMQALLLAIVVLGATGLLVLARRQHASAMATRAQLLDPLREMLGRPSVSIGADGFPTLRGRLPDGRPAAATLIVDTLVTRRLPQLWLAVTIAEMHAGSPTIGALARPCGAEFYSEVLAFPERFHFSSDALQGLLIRGDDLPQRSQARIAPALARLFADPTLKEIAATPAGIRVVRQAAEGERGAHLLLRQIRFPPSAFGPELLRRAIADADMFSAALREPVIERRRLSA